MTWCTWQYLSCRASLLTGWQERETQKVNPVLLGKGTGHAQGGLGSLRITDMIRCCKTPA